MDSPIFLGSVMALLLINMTNNDNIPSVDCHLTGKQAKLDNFPSLFSRRKLDFIDTSADYIQYDKPSTEQKFKAGSDPGDKIDTVDRNTANNRGGDDSGFKTGLDREWIENLSTDCSASKGADQMGAWPAILSECKVSCISEAKCEAITMNHIRGGTCWLIKNFTIQQCKINENEYITYELKRKPATTPDKKTTPASIATTPPNKTTPAPTTIPAFMGLDHKWTQYLCLGCSESKDAEQITAWSPTLDECKEECISVPECESVTIKDGECWLIKNFTSQQCKKDDNSTWELERNTDRKWIKHLCLECPESEGSEIDGRSFRSTLSPTLDECKEGCISKPECEAITIKDGMCRTIKNFQQCKKIDYSTWELERNPAFCYLQGKCANNNEDFEQRKRDEYGCKHFNSCSNNTECMKRAQTYHKLCNNTMEQLFTAIFVDTSGAEIVYYFPEKIIDPSTTGNQVSCGEHNATSCSECGSFKVLCHGNCKWEEDKCTATTAKPKGRSGATTFVCKKDSMRLAFIILSSTITILLI